MAIMRKNILFIDDSIVDLVTALNRIKGIKTLQSCDGHGVQYAWVTMEFSPEAGTELLNLVARKRNANIKITVHDEPWLSIRINMFGISSLIGKSPSGEWRKELEFSEAVSMANEIIKDTQKKMAMTISFFKEFNGEPMSILKQRFLNNLAESGLLEEECLIDFRSVPQGAYDAFSGNQREVVFVRGILEVKEHEGFLCTFLRGGSKHTFVEHCYFDQYALKARDIIEGDGWAFYDFIRWLSLSGTNCILLDAEESGRSFDNYFVLHAVRSINGRNASSN